MAKQKDVLTTGDAARMCGISQQTIIRCCDDGTIPCFKIPGSTHRRITRDRLYSFMKANSIPIPIEDDSITVLYYDIGQKINETLRAEASFIKFPDSSFDLALEVAEHKGAYVVLYDEDSSTMLKSLRRRDLSGILILCDELPIEEPTYCAGVKVKYLLKEDSGPLFRAEDCTEFLQNLFG